MRKILLSALFLVLTTASFAQDSSEEAIILNQEMAFLREDAENPEVFLPQAALNNIKAREISSGDKLDLDQFFFGEDKVQTKAAGPRRRAAE